MYLANALRQSVFLSFALKKNLDIIRSDRSAAMKIYPLAAVLSPTDMLKYGFAFYVLGNYLNAMPKALFCGLVWL